MPVGAQDLAEARGGCSVPSRAIRLSSVRSQGDAGVGAQALTCTGWQPGASLTEDSPALGSGLGTLSSF